MKKLCFLIFTLIFTASVEANSVECERGEDASCEVSACPPGQNEQNGQNGCCRCRRCRRRYRGRRYLPIIRTNAYYYYYYDRDLPSWPGKKDFYFFDVLRR